MKTIKFVLLSAALLFGSISLKAQDEQKIKGERSVQSTQQRSNNAGCQMELQGLNTSSAPVFFSESNFSGFDDVIGVQSISISHPSGYGIGGAFTGGWRGVTGSVASSVTTTFVTSGLHGLNSSAGLGPKYGVYGDVLSSGTATKYGVFGIINSTAENSTHIGVYGQALGGPGTTLWAGFFEGNVNVTGDITAANFIGDGSQLTNLPTSGGGCNEYGDGSAGDVTISADTDWSTSPPTNGNYMFNNLIVNSGVTLTVESGTVIQVSNTFTNNGTVEVKEGLPGETWEGLPDGGVPRTKGNTLTVNQAYKSEQLRFLSRSSLLTGGSPGQEAGGSTSPDSEGGFGGGALNIKAITISNMGTIRANGGDGIALPAGSAATGSGGGGGGFIIIQGNSITNTGTIEALGGDGGEPATGTNENAGGGGGGGLVHLISPNANAVGGTFLVDAGAGGLQTTTQFSRGGAGGASAGDGGAGGYTDFNNNVTPAGDGGAGLVLRTEVPDPCSFSN